MNWPRVNRHRPCAICGKPDWCTYNDDGSACMRVESPIQMRNGGWWHPNNLSGGGITKSGDSEGFTDRPPTPSQALNCDALLHKWQQSQNGQLEPFAATLGVSQDALKALGCVWAGDHRAFAFPMVDANRRVIGIRLRNERGEKWAVKGSRSGLFMNLSGGVESRHVRQDGMWPQAVSSAGPAKGKTELSPGEHEPVSGSSAPPAQLLIVEGPTDTAAAIDLGFSVIGRPACLGCEDMIVQMVKQSPRVRLFIIADSDAPGQRGAAKLQEKLHKARIVTLPAKDLREFVQLGGTRLLLNAILQSSV